MTYEEMNDLAAKLYTLIDEVLPEGMTFSCAVLNHEPLMLRVLGTPALSRRIAQVLSDDMTSAGIENTFREVREQLH